MPTKFGFACRTVTTLLYLVIVYNIPEYTFKVNVIFIFCLYNLSFIYGIITAFYRSHTRP